MARSHRGVDVTAPTVAVFSRAGRDTIAPEVARQLRRRAELRFHRCDGPPPADVSHSLLGDVDVLASTNLCLPALDEELVTASPRLRHVVLYATGYDHLDMALLRRHGIRLHTLPDYATRAVAEHAVAMIMALASRLSLANDRSRGRAPREVSLRGCELGGRTLGVIGMGRIGSTVAALGRGLGMAVVGSDIDPVARRRAERSGVLVVPTPVLVRECDVVAVCASTLPGTGPILDRGLVSALSPDGFVVSVARPSRVDVEAVAEALRGRRLRGFAIDDVVLDPHRDADLLDEGRVLQTGHSAWWRDEVLERGSRLFGEAILAAVDDVSATVGRQPAIPANSAVAWGVA